VGIRVNLDNSPLSESEAVELLFNHFRGGNQLMDHKHFCNFVLAVDPNGGMPSASEYEEMLSEINCSTGLNLAGLQRMFENGPPSPASSVCTRLNLRRQGYQQVVPANSSVDCDRHQIVVYEHQENKYEINFYRLQDGRGWIHDFRSECPDVRHVFITRLGSARSSKIACPDCKSDMVISSFHGGAYSSGWVCENGREGTCDGRSSGARWFCQPCRQDICFSCTPRWAQVPKTPCHSCGEDMKAQLLEICACCDEKNVSGWSCDDDALHLCENCVSTQAIAGARTLSQNEDPDSDIISWELLERKYLHIKKDHMFLRHSDNRKPRLNSQDFMDRDTHWEARYLVASYTSEFEPRKLYLKHGKHVLGN
jgi:hypothetical protein